MFFFVGQYVWSDILWTMSFYMMPMNLQLSQCFFGSTIEMIVWPEVHELSVHHKPGPNSWESTSPLPSLSSSENLKHLLDKNMISYSDKLDMLNFSRGIYRQCDTNVKYNKNC